MANSFEAKQVHQRRLELLSGRPEDCSLCACMICVMQHMHVTVHYGAFERAGRGSTLCRCRASSMSSICERRCRVYPSKPRKRESRGPRKAVPLHCESDPFPRAHSLTAGLRGCTQMGALGATKRALRHGIISIAAELKAVSTFQAI